MTSICICKYPLIVIDKRDGYEKIFVSLPIDIFDEIEELAIPDMEVVKEKDFDDKMTTYMKVRWREIPKNTKNQKRYNVNDHIVIAGCPEDKLSCDMKSIYEAYHPIDEWNSYHMIELSEKK